MLSSTLRLSSAEASSVPAALVHLLEGINTGDVELLLGAFTADASVNDQLVEYRGTKEVRAWAEQELYPSRVTMIPQEVRVKPASLVATCEVKGDFDGLGLPEPLILLLYISFEAERIDQLILIRKTL
jgi:hypothetical protein